MRHVLSAAVSVALVLTGCAGAQRLEAVQGARSTVVGASSGAIYRSGEVASDRALAAARSQVSSALQLDAAARRELLRDSFLIAVRDRDRATAAELRALWLPPSGDVKASWASVELAMLNLDFDSAQSLAWSAVERFEGHRPALMRLWYRTLTTSPGFLPDDVGTLTIEGPVERVEHLGGGSTITYRFRRSDATLAAFKPYQTRRQSNYRGELAAYRLCALIHCRFEVPQNREMRISRDDFLALNGRETESDIRRFDNRYDDLIWFEDDDGELWLHGTVKDWVPEFRLFGIEFRTVWRPLVQQDDGPDDESIEHLMAQAFNTRRAARLPETGDLGDLSFESLARQLSNLHVFDYLLNNWDRYSRRYWGVNCQWQRDRFVSIDNGAAFPDPGVHGSPASRVRYNFAQIEPFSTSTINAIRWMETEALYRVLFPATPFHDEKPHFEAFVRRREMLLARVDELIDEYGEDAVMAFD